MYSVFKALLSPTLPVAIPYIGGFALSKPIAYRSALYSYLSNAESQSIVILPSCKLAEVVKLLGSPIPSSIFGSSQALSPVGADQSVWL